MIAFTNSSAPHGFSPVGVRQESSVDTYFESVRLHRELYLGPASFRQQSTSPPETVNQTP
jgi:hypothetical protein